MAAVHSNTFVSAAAEIAFQVPLAAKSAKVFRRFPARLPACIGYVNISPQLRNPGIMLYRLKQSSQGNPILTTLPFR